MSQYPRAALLSLSFALFTSVSAQASTNLLQNGSFEASSPASDSNSYCYTNYVGGVACHSVVPGWSGDFVLISADNGPWNNPQGLGNSAAIDGSTIAGIQNESSLSQTISLAAGSYTLSWVDTNRNGYGDNQTYDVKLNGSVLDTFSTQAGAAWAAHTLTFTVASAGLQTLSFAGQSLGGDRTSFIDNVQLVSAVPEPSDLAMALAGLAVVGSMMRRRTAR